MPVALTVMPATPLVVSASSAAETVTFWFAFQFAGVKVSEPPAETVMSVSPEARVDVTVTLAVGAAERRTAYVTMPPSGTLTLVGVTTSCGVVPPHTVPLRVNEVGSAFTPL
jgi:hypothetical protein